MHTLFVHSIRKHETLCHKKDLNYAAFLSLLGLLFLWSNCVTCELDHRHEGPKPDHTNSHLAPRPQELELTVPSEPPHEIRKRSSMDQPLRIHLHYDASIHKLEKQTFDILTNTVFPQAVTFWQRALKVRRPEQRILLNRKCLNGNVFYKENHPHRAYCQVSCEPKTKCYEVEVPEDHLDACRACDEGGDNCKIHPNSTAGAGILNSDFLLYVSALQTDLCKEYIAYTSAPCQQEPSLDRPIAGLINLCPSKLNEKVEKLISNAKHEIVHVLALSGLLFAFFRDDEGSPLTQRDSNGRPPFNEGMWQTSNRIVRTIKRLNWKVSGRSISREVNMIVTPRAVQEVRKHFNCSDLEGAELEDQAVRPYWESRVFGNEAMTTIRSSKPVFSRITFALLEDTGWYRANYDMAEELHWGRNLGCDFVKKSCMHWMMTRKEISPFCNQIRPSPMETECTRDHRSRGACNLIKHVEPVPAQYRIFGIVPNSTDNDCNVTREDLNYYGGSSIMADYCPFVEEFEWKGGRWTYCYDEKNNPTAGDNWALEEYGNGSKCFYHTDSKWKRQSSKTTSSRIVGSGCYRYSCDNGLLRIFVSNRTFTCDQPGKELKIEMTVGEFIHHGGIKCPSFESICGG